MINVGIISLGRTYLKPLLLIKSCLASLDLLCHQFHCCSPTHQAYLFSPGADAWLLLLSVLNSPLYRWGLIFIHRLTGQFLSCLGCEMTDPWRRRCLSSLAVPGDSYLCSTSSMESAWNLMTWLSRSAFRFRFFSCLLSSSSCFKHTRISISPVFVFTSFCDMTLS